MPPVTGWDRRRSATVAGWSLAAVVGVLAAVVLPVALGEGGCGGGDCPDLVTRAGTEYVVRFDCEAVDPARHRSPESGVYDPAVSGSPRVDVTTYAIAGQPVADVIAVRGPRGVVCPDGDRPGHAVASAP